MAESETSKVTLKTDTKGYLRLLRSSSFSDPYTFLAEAMQNAQRAKATQVDITIDPKYILIKDNGLGLEAPEALFTLAKTGWDEETVEAQQPFGIGFFSALALGDVVNVRSKNRWFDLDYQALMDSEDLEIPNGTLEEPVEGFEVKISRLTSSFNLYIAIDRAREICSHIRSIKSTVNEEEVELKDYLEAPTDKEVVWIDYDGKASGWICLGPYHFDSGLSIYHDDRYVTDLDLKGIDGAISVELSALTLRAPDRRDVIKDQKYDDFLGYLKNGPIKQLIRAHLAADNIDIYQVDTVQKYLKPSEYVDLVSYTLLELDSLQPIIAEVKSMEQSSLQRMSKWEFQRIFRSKLKNRQVIPYDVTWTSEHKSPNFDPPSEQTNIPPKVLPSIIEATPLHDQIPKVRDLLPDNIVGFDELKRRREKSKIYYAEPLDLNKKPELIQQLMEFGRSVFVARTRFEVEALKELGGIYIGDAAIVNRSEMSVHPRKDSIKVRRVCVLLQLLLDDLSYNVEVHTGRITDLRTVIIDGVEVDKTTVHPVFVMDNRRLILDVEAVKKSRVVSIRDPRVDIGELLFILQHIQELADTLRIDVENIARSLSNLKTDWIITNRISKDESDDTGDIEEEVREEGVRKEPIHSVETT